MSLEQTAAASRREECMSGRPRPPPASVSAPVAPSVVGIGVSAGGLKALQAFFEAVPAESGMAYVVIMHLDPERESRVAAILQDRAAIPVTQVTGPVTVEADHAYVIPPGHDLELHAGAI